MNDEVIALVSACILAFVVRFFNIVIQWLAKVLKVNPPEPIPAGPAAEAVRPYQRPSTPASDPPGTNQPPDA